MVWPGEFFGQQSIAEHNSYAIMSPLIWISTNEMWPALKACCYILIVYIVAKYYLKSEKYNVIRWVPKSYWLTLS